VNFDKFCDCGEETRPLLVQAWADKQRGKYRKGELSTDKIGKLESLPDWRWSFGIKWDEMFQKLKETKCMPNCDGSQLSNWVQAQKARFNQEKLTKDRVQKLENLKFWVWDQTIQQNHKILEKAKSVVTFYKKNKHNPNGNSTNVEEKSLGNFYYRRKAVKAGRSREGVISSEEDQIYINAGLPDWPR
jgi:NADH:ubiquinone oxidoreductase subunit E